MTMRGASAAKTSQREAKDRQQEVLYDRELEALPPELRWREWMLRVEAVIFASSEPVSREMLARVVGKECSIDLLVDDLIDELRDRPYDLVLVAGGWQHRTRARFAETIRISTAPARSVAPRLSETESMVLSAKRSVVTRSLACAMQASSFQGREARHPARPIPM